jgi:hypothetical protein
VPTTLHLTATPPTLNYNDGSKGIFTLHNTGDADVHVSSITITGPNASAFHVKPPTSFTMHKKTTHAVEVDLTHALHAAAHATVTVHSNAGDVHVALVRSANPIPHGPPQPGGPETPSTGPNTDSPSGDGWGVNSPVGSAPGFSTSPDGTGTGGGGGCFVAGTRVLMADGTSRPIEEIGIGDAILAIPERDHAEQPSPAARTARIEHVFRHDGGYPLLDVAGIRATPVHRWGVREGGDEAGFLRTDQLGMGTALRTYDGGSVAWRETAEPRPAGSAETVYNFATSARTYLVGASADGPWYVVHNDKKSDPDDDEPKAPPTP